MNLSLKVDPTSGGHDHGSGHPKGGLSGVSCSTDASCSGTTSGGGKVSFSFNAPEVSGTHTLTASCDKCTNGPQSVGVNVKVKEADAPGWDHLTNSPGDYALVGGETGKAHTDNHYLTAAAKENLMKIIKKSNKAFSGGPLLQLNDASLVWGGKFDIHGKWGKDSDHFEHRRGAVIDIRANQRPDAIPEARFEKFKKAAAESGTFADLHCNPPYSRTCPGCILDTGPNRHFHVRLLGKNAAY